MNLFRFAAGVVLLCCLSCGTTVRLPAPPPPELPGGFQFREQLQVPASDVGEKQAESGYAFRYQGAAPLTVTVFQMKSDASAFELVQKSRPEPGTLFFQAGSKYVLLSATGIDQARLNEIAKYLEERLR
jgi:hypothetical protein